MRVVKGVPVDDEVDFLRGQGLDGSLNDMQYSFFDRLGIPGALPDKHKAFGPVSPAAPTVTTPVSISPNTGEVGSVTFTVALGVVSGTPSPFLVVTATYNGSPVTLASGDTYTPTEAGTLEVTVQWANGVLPSAQSVATAVAVDPPPPDPDT